MTSVAMIPKLPLKYVASINDEALNEKTDPDMEIKYIDIGNVESTGRILDVANYIFGEAPSRARRIVRHGDVIISTVRTYLQAIGAIQHPPDNLIVSTGFAVVRSRQGKLDPSYCKYALREIGFISEVISRSVGVSYPAITSMDLGNIPIYVPSLSQQASIANFLDCEIARIDALIDAKQRLIELLAEKRQALISHSVTHGLNPDTPFLNTGLSWLGDIPKHWELEFDRWLFDEIDERSETGEEELLSVSHLTGVTPRSEKDVNMFMAETNEGYKICQPGDLVINTLWAWMGAMGVAFQYGLVSPAYNVYRPTGQYNPRYLDFLVRVPNFAKEATRYSKGVWSSRLRLYPEEFFLIQMPVPPLDEQQEIVDYLDGEISKIDRLSQATQSSITLLSERRTALISAAVTGQIEIPEASCN